MMRYALAVVSFVVCVAIGIIWAAHITAHFDTTPRMIIVAVMTLAGAAAGGLMAEQILHDE